ncbi:unnamed protein product, partial [marine sediment metagenome]
NRTDEAISYFSVDLTGLSVDDVIHSATLGIYGQSCASSGGGNEGTLLFHEVFTDSIPYEDKTWNNQPCGTGFDSANCNMTYDIKSGSLDCGSWTFWQNYDITNAIRRNKGSTLDMV